MYRGSSPTYADIRKRREKWDRWFLGMVDYVSTASKDPSTKVGAVIVRPDLTVAAVGYNGFPRGMADDPELYAHRPTKYSRIVHGEMNAILNAHGSVDGCTLYVPFPPCDRCAVHVVQAGIKRVVYLEPTEDIKSRWSEAFEMTAAIFEDAGMEVTVIPLEKQKHPKLLVSIEMPSVNGEKVVGMYHQIDLGFLETQTDISTDDARMKVANGIAKALGSLNLKEVSN